ncbi:MAG: hypothetical protein KAI77_00890 [Gammaproteobacteria bacterium]|nr:hypothetical protein [Gammaproteobacteria bacterium]
MFRKYAGSIPDGANSLFRQHPLQLATLLEQAWELRIDNTTFELGHPNHRSDIPGLPGLATGAAPALFAVANPDQKRKVQWDHLIYAYMIENTRIYEIFYRVVREFLHGEQLGVPLPGSEHWLRNTEELFYKNPAPFSITAVTSNVRSDLGSTRRNAYYRMFGMDLNHGTDDKKEYPYMKAKASNMDYVSTFENLLREVWVGISNLNSTTTNTTDDAAIANLAEKLHNMLISRRETGNLSREEFYAVSTMSWFHLTLEFDSPIVKALRAEATSPEQRLFKIAERVGLPAHGISRSYFELADPMSRIMTLIETGTINTTGAASAFYNPAGNNTIPDDMKTIINHWSIVTGRNMKTRKTQVTI